MLYLKKYLTEGLIQVAILLSLCGVRVDVGLEPYLPPSWHEMILGPTSTLTQTQFHNLRNRMEDGYGLYPKSLDLDQFFTARRLLGWVRSLDRLQVPNAELETWLVQRERDTLPGETPEQPSPLERASAGQDRERVGPPLEPGAGLSTLEQPEEGGDDVIKEDDESTESLWSIGRYDQSTRPIGPFNQEVGQDSFLASERHRQNTALDELGEEEQTTIQSADRWRDGARREEQRREGGRREEQRREGGRREEQRREGGRREEQRREGGRREEQRREGGRLEEQRRDGRRRFYDDVTNRELAPNEADRTSLSLQECLRLLETFPLTQETQLSDDAVVSHQEAVEEHLSPARGPLLPPVIPLDDPCLDLELQWQDLLAFMDVQDMDVDSPAPVALSDHRVLDDAQDSRTIQNPGSADLHHRHNSSPVVRQDVSLQEAALQQGPPLSLPHSMASQTGVRGQPLELHPALVPLMPSEELDDFSLSSHTQAPFNNYNMNPTQNPLCNMDLPTQDGMDNLNMGLHTQDDTDHFNMNLVTEDLSFDSDIDVMQDTSGNVNMGPYTQYPASGALNTFDMNFYQSDPTSSSSPSSLELNGMSRNLSTAPSNHFLVGEEEEGDEGLSSPLGELLEDAAILDEINLLDLALEEGFSPEMTARLEEEGYFGPEVAESETGNFGPKMADMEQEDEGHPGAKTVEREEQGHLGSPKQGQGEQVDSDSGLSLNFSHSPASPCVSEASSYSSSSSSSSSSSASAVGSPFPEEEEEEEEMVVDFDMEVQVKIEEEEEEEQGAVGGSYSTDVRKIFPMSYQEPQLYRHLPWLEHIGHDHTYNQPWSSSPTPGKSPSKHPKSSLRHIKPYHRSSLDDVSEAELRSRDEHRARAMKIPFSNDLIVHLPVEEFNDLLANHRLNEEQLTLVRDIRRRGKNKMAAQNCRRRKLDVLLGLEDDVSGLRRRRARLLREKQEMLRSLKEMRHSLSRLQQEVFSSLRDEEGQLLEPTEYTLQFGTNGSVAVSSRQQGAALRKPDSKAASKKQRHMKK